MDVFSYRREAGRRDNCPTDRLSQRRPWRVSLPRPSARPTGLDARHNSQARRGVTCCVTASPHSCTAPRLLVRLALYFCLTFGHVHSVCAWERLDLLTRVGLLYQHKRHGSCTNSRSATKQTVLATLHVALLGHLRGRRGLAVLVIARTSAPGATAEAVLL